ncbi:MAG: dTDP-4-dehydrorhamnose reductase [Candidatus Aminicenantia bacterium]
MKIAIIGANGQLGSDLIRVLENDEVIPLYHHDIDITNHQKTKEVILQIKPEILINTAAYHRVDECEDFPEKSFKVNSVAVWNLANICQDINCVFVHFSTDYVFDGKKKSPYTEEDSPNPLNVYGNSKLTGEYFVKNICQKYFLIRTSGLYGIAGAKAKKGNFVDLMLKLEKIGKPIKVVNDQILTPTYTFELAEKISQLIKKDIYGLYHLTNQGQCNWYEFAKTIFEFIGKKPALSPISSGLYGAKAKRPKYSVLENKRACQIDLGEFSPWKDALRAYLKEKNLI